MSAREYNFDGLIGPTHNFSGLAQGNVASAKNRYSVSHPRKAALQGLAKMKLMLKLGLKQGIILPQERPDILALRKELKLKGSDRDVLEIAYQKHSPILLKYSSASSMWVANAATVSPSSDTADKKIHITPANLISHPHRAIEAVQTDAFLRYMFKDKETFHVHHPLSARYFDEGAANHLRLSDGFDREGIEVFVYGKGKRISAVPRKYPARQNREASAAIVKAHGLNPRHTVFLQQNPAVIDQGVFHNDVIAVSNENVLLYHEDAYTDPTAVQAIAARFGSIAKRDLIAIKVFRRRLSIRDAVRSYFFNSQIVTLPSGQMALIAPQECKDGGRIEDLIDDIIAGDNPIRQVHFVDLTESMKNGGGPACLRLRIVLTQTSARSVHPGFVMNDQSVVILEKWIKKHYRDKLHIDDLGDYDLFRESRNAIEELTRLLNIGPIYSFQK